MPAARLVLCEVRELEIRREELLLLERERGLLRLHAAILEDQEALAEAAKEEAARSVDVLARRAADAEARADAWWRHPLLWFCLGVVLAGSGAVALAAGT
jgi:hypothetical protein